MLNSRTLLNGCPSQKRRIALPSLNGLPEMIVWTGLNALRGSDLPTGLSVLTDSNVLPELSVLPEWSVLTDWNDLPKTIVWTGLTVLTNGSERSNPLVLQGFGLRGWTGQIVGKKKCGWRDLNSQGRSHTPLKRACLPIPPHPLVIGWVHRGNPSGWDGSGNAVP